MLQGDAEDLPFEADSFDRYVSAGSIEYWPDPQRGITEAYRVVRPGGIACVIGPVHPTHPVSRFFADVWMLFPTEAEYIEVEGAGRGGLGVKELHLAQQGAHTAASRGACTSAQCCPLLPPRSGLRRLGSRTCRSRGLAPSGTAAYAGTASSWAAQSRGPSPRRGPPP